MPLSPGTEAPDFTLRNQNLQKVSLQDLRGSPTALVFIPFAFTGVCQGELCEIRDNSQIFEESGVEVVVINCNTTGANAAWAQQQGFEFNILSDFWPHGVVSQSYDTFDERFGYSKRTTYLIDSGLQIVDVTASDDLGVAREFKRYEEMLKRFDPA